MKYWRYLFFCSWLLAALLASCEKKETPIILPPAGYAQHASVDMGDTYETQLFFDFETGTVVKSSPVAAWDLAFEAHDNGTQVFLNGGKNVFLYNTQNTDPAQSLSTASIPQASWRADSPSGLPDSTAVGAWRNPNGHSKKEVYLLKINDQTIKKFILEDVNQNGYSFRYGELADTTLQKIFLPKDPTYNYIYFSFDNKGSVVQPEPPKTDWDIVFTRYRFLYYSLNNFPYVVSGVLANPFNTSTLADSTTGFANIAYSPSLAQKPFSNARDVIGFDWKKYNFTAGKYIVDTMKCYVLRNRVGHYWKLRFIDFYNTQGKKGAPTFQFSLIQ